MDDLKQKRARCPASARRNLTFKFERQTLVTGLDDVAVRQHVHPVRL